MVRFIVVVAFVLGFAACSSTPSPGPEDGGSGGGAGGGVVGGGGGGGAGGGVGGGAGGGVVVGGGAGGGAGGGGGAVGGGVGGGTGGDAGADAGMPDAGTPMDLCAATDPSTCTGWNARRFCAATPGGRRWLDETCAAGSGCVSGACVVGSCSDECTLGDSDGGVSCRLWNVVTNAAVALDAGTLHDRERDYTRWLKRDGLISGGVGSPNYANPGQWTQLSGMDGIGDSAIWTGTALAAEALRLKATGSPDARAWVRRFVETLHVWFTVSGSPGYLARFAHRTGTTYPYVVGLDCAQRSMHCGVTSQGASWDYLGHISRDQYQGVVLGYALAFEALAPDDPLREVMRADIVRLVKELMTERQLPVSLTFNGTRIPTTTVTARFMVVNPSEMVNGAAELTIDTSAGGDGEMWGFQEFTPDLALLVRQFPLLGWVPAIPRSSSAIMLMSFFQVALMMTENVPAYAADRAAMLAYYTSRTGPGGNANDWLAIAQQWTAGTGCAQKYYANNIMMEPLYNLARLESDPTRRSAIHALFTNTIWPAFVNTKNPFFSYLYAGTVNGVASSVATSALAQLSQFPPPPRVHRPVDLRNDPRYPHEPNCTDQVVHSSAVDVGERVVSDFIWQRDPWQLYDPGDLSRGEPGIDYLVAYWLGRHHQFIAEDTPGRCLVMR